MPLITKNEFISKYHLQDKAAALAALDWTLMQEIYTKCESINADLEDALLYFRGAERIRNVHFVKYRIKQPEKVIYKLLRHFLSFVGTQTTASEVITFENFHEYVEDMIGIRLIYLIRAQWKEIHQEVLNKFGDKIWRDKNGKKVPPLAFLKLYDEASFKDFFRQNGCEVVYGELDYRSVLYYLQHECLGRLWRVELQTKTIFEEAWFEIHGALHEPNKEKKIYLIDDYLMSLKNIATEADNLTARISYHKSELSEKADRMVHLENETQKTLQNDSIFDQIRNYIKSSEMEKAFYKLENWLREKEIRKHAPDLDKAVAIWHSNFSAFQKNSLLGLEEHTALNQIKNKLLDIVAQLEEAFANL